jgi:hypothetical protein
MNLRLGAYECLNTRKQLDQATLLLGNPVGNQMYNPDSNLNNIAAITVSAALLYAALK